MTLVTISFLSSASDSGQCKSLFSKFCTLTSYDCFQSSVALFLLFLLIFVQLMYSNNKKSYLPDAFRLNGDTFVFFESDFTSIHTEVHTPTFCRNLAACQHNFSLLVFFCEGTTEFVVLPLVSVDTWFGFSSVCFETQQRQQCVLFLGFLPTQRRPVALSYGRLAVDGGA